MLKPLTFSVTFPVESKLGTPMAKLHWVTSHDDTKGINACINACCHPLLAFAASAASMRCRKVISLKPFQSCTCDFNELNHISTLIFCFLIPELTCQTRTLLSFYFVYFYMTNTFLDPKKSSVFTALQTSLSAEEDRTPMLKLRKG